MDQANPTAYAADATAAAHTHSDGSATDESPSVDEMKTASHVLGEIGADGVWVRWLGDSRFGLSPRVRVLPWHRDAVRQNGGSLVALFHLRRAAARGTERGAGQKR